MAAWIFQSNPSQTDLRTDLRINAVNPWMATRYRSEMVDGDVVYFWLAGSPEIRGIYGRGRIVGEAFRQKDDTPVIKVSVETRYDPYLSISKIRKNKKLQELDILRSPIGTNFRLTEAQASAIEAMASE